jgi:hypothetical protein
MRSIRFVVVVVVICVAVLAMATERAQGAPFCVRFWSDACVSRCSIVQGARWDAVYSPFARDLVEVQVTCDFAQRSETPVRCIADDGSTPSLNLRRQATGPLYSLRTENITAVATTSSYYIVSVNQPYVVYPGYLRAEDHGTVQVRLEVRGAQLPQNLTHLQQMATSVLFRLHFFRGSQLIATTDAYNPKFGECVVYPPQEFANIDSAAAFPPGAPVAANNAARLYSSGPFYASLFCLLALWLAMHI